MDTPFSDHPLWTEIEIRSPKRKRPTKELERVWYEYHAGFSAGFVDDVIQHLALPQRSVVLDPWNGTGITTQVTQRKGHQAVGVDLNPAMVMVAKARQLNVDTALRIREMAAEIVRLARRSNRCETITNAEPLLHWLTPDAASVYRQLEYAVQEALTTGKVVSPPPALDDAAGTGDMIAFFYVALFRTLRRGLSPFATSNPTWIRT
jgi:SAM-dependent methyltransferase